MRTDAKDGKSPVPIIVRSAKMMSWSEAFRRYPVSTHLSAEPRETCSSMSAMDCYVGGEVSVAPSAVGHTQSRLGVPIRQVQNL